MPPSAQLSSALVQAARGMRVYVCMCVCMYIHVAYICRTCRGAAVSRVQSCARVRFRVGGNGGCVCMYAIRTDEGRRCAWLA